MRKIREEVIKIIRHETGFGIKNYGAVDDEIIDLCNAEWAKRLEKICDKCKERFLNE